MSEERWNQVRENRGNHMNERDELALFTSLMAIFKEWHEKEIETSDADEDGKKVDRIVLKEDLKIVSKMTPSRIGAFLYDIIITMDSHIGDLEMEEYEKKKKAKENKRSNIKRSIQK